MSNADYLIRHCLFATFYDLVVFGLTYTLIEFVVFVTNQTRLQRKLLLSCSAPHAIYFFSI